MTKYIEREAFEKSNNVNPDWSFKFDEKLQQYIALESEMELQVDEFNEHWDTFRAGWQAAKAHEAKKIEGCVVVPVEDIINLKRRIEHRYTNANEAINAEGWNPIISGHLDALDWAEQDVSEYLGKYVADVEAARGGNE